MKIKILTVGGTIDKIYFDANSEFQVGDPQIGDLLVQANVSFEYDIEPLLRKDSLEMTDEDRMMIRAAVERCADQRILITHGTDTMADTARALTEASVSDGSKFGNANKTIVLTGSMQPARLQVSDAIFNIGFAVAALQQLGPGVYIAMNGQVFEPGRVRKNLKKQRFEAL